MDSMDVIAAARTTGDACERDARTARPMSANRVWRQSSSASTMRRSSPERSAARSALRAAGTRMDSATPSASTHPRLSASSNARPYCRFKRRSTTSQIAETTAVTIAMAGIATSAARSTTIRMTPTTASAHRSTRVSIAGLIARRSFGRTAM